MSKVNLQSVASLNIVNIINSNFDKIANELNNKALYRNNPVGEPNAMITDLDMNGKRVYNLPVPSNLNEAARLQDVVDAVAGARTAALTSFVPYGSIISTNVQGAIQELADDIAGSAFESESWSVKQSGAIGDGIADDTVAVQAALNTGKAYIVFPKGTYNIGQVVVPSTVKKILGVGAGATYLTCIGTFANFSPWIYFDNASGLEIANMSVTQNKTTYALNSAFNFGSCSYVNVHDIVFNETGFIGVYMAGCANMVIQDNVFLSFPNSAIVSEVGGTRIRITGNSIVGRGTGHAIAVATGGHNEISDNFVNGAGTGTFAIAIGSSDSIVSRNRIIANLLEGINLQDASRVNITDNVVICEGTHVDFAISIYAANSPVEGCVISGNRTFLSGSSGIGVASTNFTGAFCRYNLIQDNLIVDPVRNSGAIPLLGRGGINLYGPQTQSNTVKANTIVDEASNVAYGVNEWNDGLGIPSFNYLIDNNVAKGSALVEAQHRLGTDTKCWDLETTTTNTLMSASGGTLGGATSTFSYQRRGRFAHCVFGVTITNNGTGSGTLISSIPFTSVAGTLVGKESSTGFMTMGKAAANSILINFYGAGYPAGTGSYIELSGILEIL